MDKTSELNRRLALLRRRFLEGLPDRATELDRLAKIDARRMDEETWKSMHLAAHSLKGVAASHAVAPVAEAAASLESLLAAGRCPADVLQDRIGYLRRVCETVAEAESETDVAPLSTPASAEGSAEPSAARLVYLLEDDPDQCQTVASQLGRYGYDVQAFQTSDEFAAAVDRKQPDAMLLDLASEGDALAGLHLLRQVNGTRTKPLPAVIFSVHHSLPTRIQAVRAGAHAYFPKPADINVIATAIDQLITPEAAPPLRILIVDDEPEISAYHAAILHSAGMVARELADPLRALEVIADFRPDLLLVDLYMPACTGVELAAAIRQDPSFVGLPIVYLSAETDVDKQLNAVTNGGDDFITKPVTPHRLIASIRARAERQRLLSSLVTQDPMTRLLNHTTIKDRLADEVARTRRTGDPLCFAVIDIDHFKQVNDRYGHPVGDTVIKNLAFLLRQRLRRQDIVGRYGGEEFAVVLPNTPSDHGGRLMDMLREQFAATVQWSGTDHFHVSLSCGVAELREGETAQGLIKRADAHLYVAKRQGRNQVISQAEELEAS